MQSLIAQVALLAWPVVTLGLFLMLPVQRAIIWSLVAGYLFLPVGVQFDFPGVPTLDKTTIPNIAAFLMALALARRGEFKWPRVPLVNLLMGLYVLGPILTSITNLDPIVIGTIYLPPMTFYTALSAGAGHLLMLLPFILGIGLLRDDKSHREMLVIFVVAALAYSLPVLAEVVKGPFLLARIFGIDPGWAYSQQIRGGGFRAMVFMGHGLLVSAFLGLAILAALGCWREKRSILGIPALLCAIYIFAVLVLNKTLSAFLLTFLLGVLMLALPPRRFFVVALLIAAMVVTYPILRGGHLVPYERIEAAVASFSEDRAGSFGFRLRNEEMLLNRANERPYFGWGGFGRNRIFVEQKWGGTKDVSITDGIWIIALGQYGWLGYLSLFGLLSYPFAAMYRVRRRNISPATVALAAMLLSTLLDLIPNSSLSPLTWLCAGALIGLARSRKVRQLSPAELANREAASTRIPATA